MNLEQAMLDPASVYSNPEEILRDSSLTRDQQLAILKRWEYDARELEVAEEENMGGGPPSLLREICQALNVLETGHTIEHPPPTKQGGE